MRRGVHSLWMQASFTPFPIAAARILGRPCLHPPHASLGLSSAAWLVARRRVGSTHQTTRGSMKRETDLKHEMSFPTCDDSFGLKRSV